MRAYVIKDGREYVRCDDEARTRNIARATFFFSKKSAKENIMFGPEKVVEVDVNVTVIGDV